MLDVFIFLVFVAVTMTSLTVISIAVGLLISLAKERRYLKIMDSCDPENACETHGRCWTHSEWEEEH